MGTIRHVVKHRLILAAVGTAAGFCALCVATWGVAPAVRAVFGAPVDYNTDYTSLQALLQCLAVQVGSLAIAYAAVGVSLRKTSWSTGTSDALYMANPVTIGIAFLLYQWPFQEAYSQGELAYEYISAGTGGLQVLLSMVLYAPVTWLAMRVGR